MTDKYQALLIEWCDALLRAQVTDNTGVEYGSFRCESCGFSHGRADNAVYPLVLCYTLTEEKKYLLGAKRLLAFREKLALPSGAMQNDFTSPWQGITAFSAIGLLKTLIYFGDKLPPDLKAEIKECAKSASLWVHENMVIGYPAYINYYCAAALVNALCAVYYHGEAYEKSARELLDYCLGLFTENGLLAGEGKPHDDKSPKGCYPIDVGYIAEESLPCLVHAAHLLKDERTLSRLSEQAVKLLDFMLPDGGWDNSFGVRNNKWTYYGSRTSDGCIGAFTLLGGRDPLFSEAAERTYEILKKTTHGGLLYGGPHYFESGQKPCVHHTFCHASALADAILAGIKEPSVRSTLPAERQTGVNYYPEIDTYKIRVGGYAATLTAYDYATHHFANGAAHAGGGTLSLLYKEKVGPVIAGSVYEYKRTEQNNMQSPVGEITHASLLFRAEYEREGVKYATCLDPSPIITIDEDGETVSATVKARFYSAEREAEGDLIAEFHYRFKKEGVFVCVNKVDKNVRLVLPIIKNAATVLTDDRYTKRDVLCLAGGFSADEYTFDLEKDLTLTIV